VLDNLNKPLTVPMLAERVAMSPRNFARVFIKEMKTTPAKFVERLRIEAARDGWKKVRNTWKRSRENAAFGNVNSMRNVFSARLKFHLDNIVVTFGTRNVRERCNRCARLSFSAKARANMVAWGNAQDSYKAEPQR